MRLTETYKIIKQYPDIPKDVFVFLVVILVAVGSFCLGQYSSREAKRVGDLRIVDSLPSTVSRLGSAPQTNEVTQNSKDPSVPGENSGDTTATGALGMYVGSKSGKTYYFPWCSGVKRIKEENKVWFVDKADAEARGYKAAANCSGM